MKRYNLFGHRNYLNFGDVTEPSQFKEITTCLIRKDHSCGKFLGASKSCFIACPSTDEIETILVIMTEKLTKLGIEPVIAIKDRAYGQDIFCTKICGKIIESQFCIVILDDTVEKLDGKSVNIPNPNVYYEYGLMTTLGKAIIPLQKEGQDLAFNIQTHDTIKYTPRNISAELDRALKVAIKATQEDSSTRGHIGYQAQHIFYRSMEIGGYQKKDSRWFLSDEIEDTDFVAYAHSGRQEYVLFTVETDKESIVSTLTDIQVIVKRLEAKYSDFTTDRESRITRIQTSQQEAEREEEQPVPNILDMEPTFFTSQAGILEESIVRLTREAEELSDRLALMRNIKFAVVLMPGVEYLQEKILKQYDGIDNHILKIPLYVGDSSGIHIGDVSISFITPVL